MSVPVKKAKAKRRLLTMNTDEVSIVNAGANGHKKWLLVKSEGGEPMSKAVPDKDATSEEKETAQKARAKAYGIEILSTNSNLSYPAGDPTTESLYGDPVNLKYPLGYDGNTRDEERIRNAISRFKGNHTAYSKDSSKAKVYERIVRAALAEGIDVSYDEEDEIDALLPQDLKTRLEKSDDDPSDDNDSDDEGDDNGDPPDDGTSNTPVQKSGEGANLVPDVQAMLQKSHEIQSHVEVLSKAKRLLSDAASVIESVSKSEDEGQGAEDEVGSGDYVATELEELKKSQEQNAAEIEVLKGELSKRDEELKKSAEETKRLEKALVKLNAAKARVNTTIGTSQALRPREMIKGSETHEDDSALDAIDLSPPLERPEGDF